ncbi:hypothetical protein ParKJ_38475 [Paraburkholderia fungorum]|jgi:hypothetical protein|uniref:Uncharacterized protein n=2 Tax=Paraburkholderia fungorum TaxID=134537 RepID=A0AAP5QJA7_9BURK|nr:hypothetical protein [Paraburkholderia fungorum]
MNEAPQQELAGKTQQADLSPITVGTPPGRLQTLAQAWQSGAQARRR